jgi:hypothetical protein
LQPQFSVGDSKDVKRFKPRDFFFDVSQDTRP